MEPVEFTDKKKLKTTGIRQAKLLSYVSLDNFITLLKTKGFLKNGNLLCFYLLPFTDCQIIIKYLQCI